MAWLFQPLLMLLARSTDGQLARQVEFLHAENQMLRRRLTKRVRLTPDEKRLLVKLGHASSLWQCDFFSKHVVTAEGVLRQCFILAFVNVSTRRAWVTPCSFKPDAGWMQAQAEAFVSHAKEVDLPANVVVRDRDCKFSRGFDEALAVGGARPLQTSFRSPNLNAYVERFVQSIGQECLDKLIVFGPEHLDHVIREYVAHYNEERPHQGRRNEPLKGQLPSATAEGEVLCRERLGGLLRHYYRLAA